MYESVAFDLKTSRVLSQEMRGYRGIIVTPFHGHFLHHTRLNCSRHSGYENWDLKKSSEFDFLDWQRSSKSNTLHLNSCLDTLVSEKFRSLQLRFCCNLKKDKMNPKFTVLIGEIIKPLLYCQRNENVGYHVDKTYWVTDDLRQKKQKEQFNTRPKRNQLQE